MRLLAGLSAAALLALLVNGCTTVSPDECWINTSGGFGGSGTIPIGAGVGATSGDFLTPPRRPLDSGGEPNPLHHAGDPLRGEAPRTLRDRGDCVRQDAGRSAAQGVCGQRLCGLQELLRKLPAKRHGRLPGTLQGTVRQGKRKVHQRLPQRG